MIGSNQNHPQGGIPTSGGRSVPDPVAGPQVPPPLPPDVQSPVTEPGIGKAPIETASQGSDSASTFFAGLSGQSLFSMRVFKPDDAIDNRCG